MRCSLIAHNLVEDTKGGNLGYVSEVWDFTSLEEFAFIANRAHIAPAVFRNNKRDGDHFLSIDFLCFDFDDGAQTAVRVHDQLCDHFLNHVVLASKNHLRDKGDGKGIIERFHLFIPLSEPITDRNLYRFAVKKLADLLRWQTDGACSDPTRYFYRHGETLFVKENLKPIDVRWFRSMKEMEEEREGQTKRLIVIQNQAGQERPPLWRFQRTQAWRILTEDMSGDGHRYGNSAIIVGVMIKCGIPLSQALALFDRYATYGDSFTRQSVERMYRQFT